MLPTKLWYPEINRHTMQSSSMYVYYGLEMNNTKCKMSAKVVQCTKPHCVHRNRKYGLKFCLWMCLSVLQLQRLIKKMSLYLYITMLRFLLFVGRVTFCFIWHSNFMILDRRIDLYNLKLLRHLTKYSMLDSLESIEIFKNKNKSMHSDAGPLPNSILYLLFKPNYVLLLIYHPV